MRVTSFHFITAFVFLATTGKAQQSTRSFPIESIAPIHLMVSTHQTTTIVFPYTAKIVDRGTRDVLVQRADEAPSVLFIKAARRDFPATNLTVITADKKLYPFYIHYTDSAAQTNFFLGKDTAVRSPSFSETVNTTHEPEQNEASLKDDLHTLIVSEKKFLHTSKRKHKMKINLEGIYVNEGVMYFRFLLANRSYINYDAAVLRFLIKDQRKGKRTASQELDLMPLATLGTYQLVAGKSAETLLVALPKFTIPDRKKMIVQLLEKNGGRHLQLTLRNGVLVKARPILP